MIFHSYVSLPEGNETNISTLESTSTPRDATRFAPNAAKEGMRTEQQTRDETFWPTERLVDLSWQLLPVDPLWIKTAVSQCPSGRNFRSVFFFFDSEMVSQPPATSTGRLRSMFRMCPMHRTNFHRAGWGATAYRCLGALAELHCGKSGNSYTQCE